jgi:hypothetical protein
LGREIFIEGTGLEDVLDRASLDDVVKHQAACLIELECLVRQADEHPVGQPHMDIGTDFGHKGIDPVQFCGSV